MGKTLERVKLYCKEKIFRNQNIRIIDYEGSHLYIPSKHSLLQILETEPFRNTMLKAISKFLFHNGKNHVIDVGANIGDTALAIQSSSPVDLQFTLVEPSKFFLEYLELNLFHFKKNIVINKYVSPNFPITKLNQELVHWGGTAHLSDSTNQLIDIDEQVALHTLVQQNTALIKIDCDGKDFDILETFLTNTELTPTILYENTIVDSKDLDKALNIIELAKRKGYAYGCISSCDGLLLWGGSLESSSIQDLFQFQLNLKKIGGESRLYYTDIALIHKSQESTFQDTMTEIRLIQSR